MRSEFICEDCEHVFDRKTRYDRHINRKFPCDGYMQVPDPDNPDRLVHICKKCKQVFSRKAHLRKHLQKKW